MRRTLGRVSKTVSFLPLAAEPTHKQGFLFFKRIPPSLGLRSRSAQREKGSSLALVAPVVVGGRAGRGARLL